VIVGPSRLDALRKFNKFGLTRGLCAEASDPFSSFLFEIDDDDKFTPTKHLTPPPHHSSRPAAAHTDTETPLLHQKKG